jgi:phosphoribosylaminoimidazole carboxylase (NCAIR synthetase)
MPENSRRGVAVVQWQIVDSSRTMSWDYLSYQASLRATLVVKAVSGLDGRGRWVIFFETRD